MCGQTGAGTRKITGPDFGEYIKSRNYDQIACNNNFFNNYNINSPFDLFQNNISANIPSMDNVKMEEEIKKILKKK